MKAMRHEVEWQAQQESGSENTNAAQGKSVSSVRIKFISDSSDVIPQVPGSVDPEACEYVQTPDIHRASLI